MLIKRSTVTETRVRWMSAKQGRPALKELKTVKPLCYITTSLCFISSDDKESLVFCRSVHHQQLISFALQNLKPSSLSGFLFRGRISRTDR